MSAAAVRALAVRWLAVLLAPTAWVVALGTMFPLTRHACLTGSRGAVLAVGIVCALVAMLPLPFAWRAWRRAREEPDASLDRFMFGIALGSGAIFLLVLILTNVSALLVLQACRT